MNWSWYVIAAIYFIPGIFIVIVSVSKVIKTKKITGRKLNWPYVILYPIVIPFIWLPYGIYLKSRDRGVS